jgi:uncharacterized protein with PIN domain
MRCPYCGLKIKKVLIIEEGSFLWEPYLNENEEIVWTHGEFQTADIYQICPECGEKIKDYDEKKIIKILKELKRRENAKNHR